MRPLPFSWPRGAIGPSCGSANVYAARRWLVQVMRRYQNAPQQNRYIRTTAPAMQRIHVSDLRGFVLDPNGAVPETAHRGQTPAGIDEPHCGQAGLACMSNSRFDRRRKSKGNQASGLIAGSNGILNCPDVLHVQGHNEHAKPSFLVCLSPSNLRKIRGARLMTNSGLGRPTMKSGE